MKEKHKVQNICCKLSQFTIQKMKFLFCFFAIGLINNFGYVVVGTSAQNLAKHFHKENFMSSYMIGLIVCAAFARVLNAKFWLQITHFKRVIAVILLMISGYLIMAISNFLLIQDIGFYISLFGSLSMGISQALGESVILGFLKAFESSSIGSGTGMAGVGGAGYYLICQEIMLKDEYSFLGLVLPCSIIYFLCFSWVYRKRIGFDHTQFYQHQDIEMVENKNNNNNNNNNYENNDQQISEDINMDKKLFRLADEENSQLTWKNFTRSYKIVWFNCINLGLVYFFEYCIITCFADRSTKDMKESKKALERNSYVIILFSYQIGVLISRSSLSIIQIKRLYILTLFQLINFLVWLVNAEMNFLPIWVMIVYSVVVGLFGGASYVNCYNLILKDDKLDIQDKELCVNCSTFTNDFGVLAAALITLLFDNTFLQK